MGFMKYESISQTPTKGNYWGFDSRAGRVKRAAILLMRKATKTAKGDGQTAKQMRGGRGRREEIEGQGREKRCGKRGGERKSEDADLLILQWLGLGSAPHRAAP